MLERQNMFETYKSVLDRDGAELEWWTLAELNFLGLWRVA